jgi:hypothetical protein
MHGGRISGTCKLLLLVIIIVAIALVSVSVHLMLTREPPARGSAGPLNENSPNREPPSPIMK